MSVKEIIYETVSQFLDNWESDYKIYEDLPYVAEVLTEEIMEVIRDE